VTFKLSWKEQGLYELEKAGSMDHLPDILRRFE
jgi:hypothetical protein